MNTERTVVIENIGDAYVSLRDTQKRTYLLKAGAKMRISASSLQDILDSIGSKRIFDKGNIKIGNITREELYNMGLNENEIDLYLIDEVKPAVVEVAQEEVAEEPEETIEEVEEAVEEEVVIEEPVIVEKPAVKKTAKKSTKKTINKKGK